MAYSIPQRTLSRICELAESQHGVVARRQLLELGLSPRSIAHRLASGHLHPAVRGVYAVGRPRLTVHGRWMAAVLIARRLRSAPSWTSPLVSRSINSRPRS